MGANDMKRVLCGSSLLPLGFSVVAAVLMLGLLAPSMYADVNGRVRGTVTDAQGAAVADATVKIVNVDTNYERTLTTTDVGTFDAPNLPPGTYSLTVTKGGFRTFKQTGVRLESAATYAVTATLEVGEMSATVEVVAEKLQADTTTMQLGGELAGSDLKDFPLLNRAWINLQTTLPGVVASSDRFGNNFSTNGSRSQSNNYLVNGTDSNDLPLNTPIANSINPDAIQEVKVVDATLNPEYGRNSGATLMVTTKSGTNELHGSAFEFYRDTFMNAKNFFSTKVPPFHQNQFGGSVGGPIIKNKLFFFFAYQGTRSFAGVANNTPVFSSAQRGGDFSTFSFNGAPPKAGCVPSAKTPCAPTNPNVSPIALFGDSASSCPVSGGVKCAAGTYFGKAFDNNGALITSGLFSTGVIPTQDLNSVAVGLMNSFVPNANAPGNFFQFSNNTVGSPDQYIGKLDYNLSSKDTMGFYLFWVKNTNQITLPFTGATLPGSPEVDKSAIYQYTVNETHVFNQHLVNEIRFGYNRFNFDAVEPANPVAPSSVGFTGINAQNTKGQGVPNVAVTSLFTLGFSTNGPQPRIDDTGQLLDNVSYVTGKHTFKWGIDIRRGHVSNPFNFLNNGSYSFAGGGSFSTGVPGADFLLGVPDGYNQSSGSFIDARAWEYYSYIQDQWKLKSNLTFTYGIGWQIDTPLTDHFNNSVAINAYRRGQQSTVFPTAPAGLLFPGDKGISPSGYRTRYNNFAPRIGFAWNPIRKLTVRAGWGIYYNNSEEELTLQNLLAPPFALIDQGIADVGPLTPSFANPFSTVNTSTINVTTFNGNGATNPITPPCTAPTQTNCNTPIPSQTLANKYPFLPPAPGAAVDFGFFEPFGLNVTDQNFNVPYNMNAQLTVQYQFTPTILTTFSYVGSQGRRLEGVIELNPYNAAACLAIPACPSNRSVEFFFPVGTVDDPSVFGSIGQQSTMLHSKYNSFQATVEKSLSHGLQLRAAYTYAHALDNGSSFENGNIIPSDVNATYGNAAFDARQRLVMQYLYQIPDWGFHHLPSKLTKGWSFSGVSSFQTGFPIALSDSGFHSLQCTPVVSFYGCWDRPTIVAPVQVFSNPRTIQTLPSFTGVNRTGNFYFAPASFKVETAGTVGNAGRNLFHGPGINNTDISFYKDTALTERYKLQLRVDMFNAFNHAQFSNPSGNINSTLFGRVTATRIAARITQLSVSFNF